MSINVIAIMLIYRKTKIIGSNRALMCFRNSKVSKEIFSFFFNHFLHERIYFRKKNVRKKYADDELNITRNPSIAKNSIHDKMFAFLYFFIFFSYVSWECIPPKKMCFCNKTVSVYDKMLICQQKSTQIFQNIDRGMIVRDCTYDTFA